MKKIILVGIGIVVVAIAAYLLTNSKPDAMMTDQSSDSVMADKAKPVDAMKKDDSTSEDGSMMNKDESSMMKAGSYEVYAPTKISAASDAHDVVLFFRAPWCPTCRALDADIKAHLSAIPASLTILDVDYDASSELKKKYGVTYQHTMVQVDAQGNLIKKWTGSPTLAAFIAEVE